MAEIAIFWLVRPSNILPIASSLALQPKYHDWWETKSGPRSHLPASETMQASSAGAVNEKGALRANDHAEVLYATTWKSHHFSSESTPMSLAPEGSAQSRDSWSMPGSPIANSDHARRGYASAVPRMSTSCPVIVTKQGRTLRESKRHRRPFVQLRCDYHLLDASRMAASPNTS